MAPTATGGRPPRPGGRAARRPARRAALAVLWWRDLPLGHVGPDGLAAARAGAPDGVAARRGRGDRPGGGARLRPGSVPSWLPRVRRDPGERRRHRRPARRRRHAGRPRRPARRPRGAEGAPPTSPSSSAPATGPADLARALAALAAQAGAAGRGRRRRQRPAPGRRPAGRRGGRARRPPRRRAPPRAERGPQHRAPPRPHRLVAFTDDDAEPHPAWTGQLASALAADAGPARGDRAGRCRRTLDTEAARAFEFEMGGFAQGYLPRRYDADWFAACAAGRAGLAGRRRGRHGVPARGLRRGRRVRRAARRRRRRLQRGQRALVPPARCRPHLPLRARGRRGPPPPSDDEAAAAPGRGLHRGPRRRPVRRVRPPPPPRRAARALVNLPAFLGVQRPALVTGRGARRRPAPGRAARLPPGLRHAGWPGGPRPRRWSCRRRRAPASAPRPGVLPRRQPVPAAAHRGVLLPGEDAGDPPGHPATPVRRVLEVGGGTSGLTARLFPAPRSWPSTSTRRSANPVLAATGTTFVAADAVAAAVPGRGVRRRHALRRARARARRRRGRGRGAAGRAGRRPRGGQLAERALALPVLRRARRVCPDRRGRDGRVGPRPPRLPARAARRPVRPGPDGVRHVHHPGDGRGARPGVLAPAARARAGWRWRCRPGRVGGVRPAPPGGPGTETAAAWSLPDAESAGTARRPDRAAGEPGRSSPCCRGAR